MGMMRTCKTCGVEMLPSYASQKRRCPRCLGHPDKICIRCGIVFIDFSRRRSKKYCTPVCAKVRTVREKLDNIRVQDNGCWEWQGFKNAAGYGEMRDGQKRRRAHRVQWEEYHGKAIPEGLVVRHLCHSPSCINPAHLAIGTPKDNIDDMVKAGRQARGKHHGRHTKPERTARGDRHGSHTHPESWARGSEHHKAKLTEQDVEEIKRELKNFYRGLGADLARKYGVSPEAIYDIKAGRRWTHVEET